MTNCCEQNCQQPLQSKFTFNRTPKFTLQHLGQVAQKCSENTIKDFNLESLDLMAAILKCLVIICRAHDQCVDHSGSGLNSEFVFSWVSCHPRLVSTIHPGCVGCWLCWALNSRPPAIWFETVETAQPPSTYCCYKTPC
ncbi:unnamed protein product [Lymnaea stagnalis]|uniref:Uncharacterized protein n=1 Tax=Lymnaea stagnalis TaxID=6523 RepID=A0AAV2IQK8_LYMST